MKTLSSLLHRRLLLALSVALLSMVSFSNVNAQSQEISPEVRKEMEIINHRIEECVAKKDLSSLVDLYSDDATLIIAGGKKLQGRKEIADYWYSLSKATCMKSEIVELGGNGKLVYQVGRWTITTVKDGVEQTTTTDVVLLWKRQQNYDYKIQLNSSNNPVSENRTVTNTYEAANPK